ncbi:hypothetical protein [Anabaena azotica]|uniref:Uncharacterized protein n=1 Tax=Anabaena azotica FACHB-119 TaxID=947527 RepID=A0ABR8D4G8_9NOST|nr:hypothetical protein [Anabaena azotica]MBD2501313.1 hypothetical protein [Anabaena azotica FACHB-119]
MTQPNLINQSDVSQVSEESCLIEILEEIQETPQEHWSNLLEIIRVFRKSVTSRRELLTHLQQENLDRQNQEILNQQHQALQELTREWLEEGDEQEQTETWESLTQGIDDNPF